MIDNKYIKKISAFLPANLPLNIVVALIYLALAKIGLSFSLSESGITIFWPAGGFAMAILLLAGPKYLPGVFLGALGAGFMVGGSLVFSVFTAIGNALETFCGYWLLTHYRYMNRSLDSTQDLLRLLFYGAFVSTLASATIGPATFLALNIVDISLLPSIVLRWWMADAIGIAFVTPLVLVWRRLPQRIFSSERHWEMVALFGLTFLSAQIVFFGWFSDQPYQQVSVSWLFPFIIWAGLRAGRHKVTILQLMIFTLALWSAGNEKGYFAEDLARNGLVNFWMFGMLLAIGGMLLAIISAARARAEWALGRSEQKHRAIIDASLAPVALVDNQHNISLLNPAFVKTYGYTLDDIPTLNDWWINACPDVVYRQWAVIAWQQHINNGQSAKTILEPMELRIQCKNEQIKIAHVSAVPLGESFEGAVAVQLIDISDRISAKQKLMLAAEVFKHSSDGILITDARHHFIAVNDAFTAITGYSEAEVIGKNPNLLSSGVHNERFYDLMWESIRTDGRWQGEVWNRRKNGELFPEWLSAFTVNDKQGNVVNYIGIFSDITERKASEESVKHQAQHDFLTNLPNRIMFNDRLQRQIALAKRNAEMFALLYLDLDNFKPVNDECGHHVGDILLQAVAIRLTNLIRETDTVSRRGGDEFIILTPNIESVDNIKVMAEKLLVAIEAPFHIEGRTHGVTLSIGIAIYPFHGEEDDVLMKNADAAMYQAKKGGRNMYRFYEPMHQDSSMKMPTSS
ncbi:MAG: diguanylate cyclase [Methylotenera sp.]